jgi:cyanophycin synthetase
MEEILPKEKPGACMACGDSPVPHAYTFLMNTLDAWVNDNVRSIPNVGRMLAHMHVVANRLESPLVRWAYYTCGKKTLTDPSRTPTNRALVLWEEARHRGIPMEQIAIFNSPSDYYRVKLDGAWMYFEGLPVPRRGSMHSYAWMDDKHLFKRFLEKHRIPAARAVMTASLESARAEFARFNAPVVVKPRIGSRARHTATHVRTIEDFEEAFRSAQQLCKYVLFEEHLVGKLCRATVVNGSVAGFLKKSYPTVTGDGTSTIRDLVRDKNAQKPERVWDILLNEANEGHIRRQGLTLDSILPQGVTIDVSQHSGRQVGGATHEMPTEIHPKLREYLERASRILDVPLIGFDLIIADPEADPDTQKWGILEANTLPFIDLHYNPLYGQTSNVAGALWDLWQKENPQKNPTEAGSSEEAEASYTTSFTSFSKTSG